MTVNLTEQNGAGVCSVSDQGMGILPGERERLLDLSNRAGNARATPIHGVGLCACCLIVERHGGWPAVTDTPGGSSTFTFIIPLSLSGA